MSSWGWDVNDDVAVLQKRHKQLEKQIKNAPDSAKHKVNKDQIDREINDKKLEYAQKQFDLEQMKLQWKAARDKFQYHLQQQKEEAKIKEKHYGHMNRAKTTLHSKLGGTKYRNPGEKRIQMENEIRQHRLDLQIGDHSNNEEKLLIRTIDEKKHELQLIQAYIENNGVKYQKDYEVTAKEFKGALDAFKQKVKKTDDASKERENLKKETEQLNEEKNEISEGIKELATQKQDTQKAYQQKVKDYEKNRREHSDITVAMAMKKNRRQKERETKEVKKKHEQHKAAEEVKKMKKREEELERQKATEGKRQKAIEAYNNMQKKLKAKNTSFAVARPTSGGAKKVATTSTRVDPHAVEKEICRSLIVLCESMVPTGRSKKKKKVRLVYRADSFVKFNQVGVKIPKYAKQLGDTIKALNKRIESYDEEIVEEVPAKEEASKEESSKEEVSKDEASKEEASKDEASKEVSTETEETEKTAEEEPETQKEEETTEPAENQI